MEINFFAFIILLILLYAFKKNKTDLFRQDQLLFERMIYANMAILIFDIGTCVFNGQTFYGARLAGLLLSSAFYLTTPLLGFFYALYCQAKLDFTAAQKKKTKLFFTITLILNAIAAIASIFTPIIFTLDQNNHYLRGPLFSLSMIFCYLPVATATAQVLYALKKSNPRDRSEKRALLLFIIPPIIGGCLQILSSDFPLIWISTVISILLLYITIQNSQLATDSLTGVFNRRQLLPYLKWKSMKVSSEKQLFVIIMDIDDFKQINDSYGHIVGDEALRTTVSILKHCCSKGDFIARYGGDEFVAVIERSNRIYVDALIEAIDNALTLHNQTGETPYTLSLTAGYSELDDGPSQIDAAILAADQIMYQAKKAKKASD